MARWCIGILITFASAAHAQQLALIAPAHSANLAGRVLFATGDVQGLDLDGFARKLSKGDVVREGEVIRTGAESHVQLRMADEALLALRPDSRVRLHTYRFVEQGEDSGRASIEVLIGGLRSITGAIGRIEKQNYIIRGGKALIGVRGTDHETFVVDEGTYNRVTLGGTYLESAGSRIDLDPSETGFAGAGDERPTRLERTPRFMYAAFEQGAVGLGPEMRAGGLGDERRLRGGLRLGHDKEQGRPDHAAGPVLPPRALGENAHNGFGKGGRCGGPCSDPKIK
jgi:hypothetical protein